MSNLSINPVSGVAAKTHEDAEALRYLVADYVPDADFTSGGAFRFGPALRALNQFLGDAVKHRKISSVLGAMPCVWSLDWREHGQAISDLYFVQQLNHYAQTDLAVGLCFDNPFIRKEILNDTHGLALVKALADLNPSGKNFLCVAHDGLRDFLHQCRINLPIVCHQNRIIADQQRRSALYYNRLAEQYDRVILHPSDGSRLEVTKDLADKDKFIIILNDPCLRTCPVRREHLLALANRRIEPYQTAHLHQCAKLIKQTACIEAQTLLAGQSANLGRAQIEKLYEQGFRRFVFQSQRHVRGLSLLTDIMNYLFTASPEHSHQVSALQANFFQLFSQEKRQAKSGLDDFRFKTY